MVSVWQALSVSGLFHYKRSKYLKYLKGRCRAEIAKFRFAYFYVIAPNVIKYST